MKAISYTAAKRNPASVMGSVCSDDGPVVIRRRRGRSVVMLSLEEYESFEETAYLLRSPANAMRLVEAIHSLETGRGIAREIDLEV